MENESSNPSGQSPIPEQTPGFSNEQSVDLAPIFPTEMPQPHATNSTASINNRKIRFWKKLSITLGVFSLVGYFVILIIANVLAHGDQFGWVIFMIASLVVQRLMLVSLILSIISFIRVIILSSQRKRHLFKDYLMVVIGLILIFSPIAASGVLSFFRISWGDDNSISVTLKSKDPYHITGSSSAGSVCTKGHQASNELKNVNIDDYYSYVGDAKERKLFAAAHYVESISEEIQCQVGEFYKKNNRFPNADEIEKFSAEALNDDLRNHTYNIKLETGAKPNQEDFTILFNRSCNNREVKQGNVAILSPHYGADGRYCSYNNIETIVKNLTSNKTTTSSSNSSSAPKYLSATSPLTVAHRCWGAVGKGQVFSAKALDNYAVDIACAFLSYQSHEKTTPTTQADIMKYLPADYGELLPDHATPTITFNANNPIQPYVFNICTSVKCNPDFSDKIISVFFVNPLKPDLLSCSEVESYDASLYDLKDTDSWYKVIFDNYPRNNTYRFYSNTN